MKLNRAKTFAIATAAALLLGTGTASAAQLKGSTSQGKTVTLKTAADGSIKSAKVTWKTECKNGATANGSTTFRNLKRSTPTGFSSSGKDVDKKGKYKYTFRSSIDGSAKGLGFEGTFESKVKVTKGGDNITSCKTGKVRWSAS